MTATTRGRAMLAGRRDVPNAPFQARFYELQAQGERPADIARRLGWYDHGRPDGPRVKRVLGLRPNGRGTKGPAIRTHITYRNALRLADAMGLDPWEIGL